MESELKIREQVRSAVIENRLASRDNIWKSKRKALDDVIDIGRTISEKEVIILANKLKTKSLVQAEDLTLLKIAFVQSALNIIAFLKVKGALHGLVREVSSTKANIELLAVECICNLALGDAKSSLIIAKAAGPYLLTILSGFNNNLKATSVWSLGNLVSSGEKPWKILHSQGFVGKLLQLITENDNLPDLRQDLQQNSLIALSHLLRVGVKYLTVEEIQSITKAVVNLKNTHHCLFGSIFLLSCIETADKELIENKIYLKSLEFIREVDLTVETVKAYTACVRILANLVTESSGICAKEVLQNWHCIQESIKKIAISNFEHLVMEFGWLLGNIMNHPSPQVQTETIKFINDLKCFESKIQCS